MPTKARSIWYNSILQNEEEDGSVDSRAIKQAVMQAIGSWGESDNEQR